VIFSRPSGFVTQFVDSLDQAVRQQAGAAGLSKSQRCWLAFCVMAVIVTNSICWARFARACLGRYSVARLSWFFVRATIAWEKLLQASVAIVLREHGVTKGTLVIDDTDKKRSKTTTRIWGVSKLRDKTTGGYVQGQSIVAVLLVTPTITLPVGFAFHRPDPAIQSWAKNNRALKKQGIPRNSRPPKPARNIAYPTKIDLALRLLKQFKMDHTPISVKAILADAAYGTAHFMDDASAEFSGAQVVTELRCNQRVAGYGRAVSLEQYFRRRGVERTLIVRSHKEQAVVVDSARQHIKCHGKKRFVIALKYEGESEYRYLAASDLAWRTNDIVSIWTLRWLVEVFFEDWKGHEGWDALTKQQGEDGSRRGLTLSLLVDHCLLLHPAQLAQMKHKRPAFTVGSLMSHIKADALMTIIQDLIMSDDPVQNMAQLAEVLREQFVLRVSEKHMVGRDLGHQEPTPALRYRVERLPNQALAEAKV
jgi:hypothetical protein